VSHYVPYPSPQFAWAPSGQQEFADFVPPRGPRNGRNIIKGFTLCVDGTIDVATATWDGRDIARLFSNIIVETRSGSLRWSLSGPATRLASIYLNGIKRHQEHADLTAGAGKTVALRLYIPMEKPHLKRGIDFGLPADVFRRIFVNYNSLAGAATTTTVLSNNALTVKVLAEYREESNVELKAEDFVGSVNFTSNTQVVAKFIGSVHDAFIHREAAAAGTVGGEVITAITDVRCDEFGIPLLTRADLLHSYTMKREIAPSAQSANGAEVYLDPFRGGKALPILAGDKETSPWSGKVHEVGTFNLGTGAAGLSLVTRQVMGKNDANFNAQVAAHDIDVGGLRMKTAGKTKRGLGQGWSKRQLKVGVLSAPLKDYQNH
jgi:hypothetical protein